MQKHLHSIEYYPPADETVESFVRNASLRMAAMRNDQGYLDPEVTWGLSEFIKFIGEIRARQLNEASSGIDFDNPDKPGYPSI